MTLMNLIEKGGPLMWALLAFSVITLAVTLERAIFFLRYGLPVQAAMERILSFLESKDVKGLEDYCASNEIPVAAVCGVFLRHRRRAPKSRDEAVHAEGRLIVERMERWLKSLSTIGYLSPMVGLFGTVLGMIEAFQRIQNLQGAARPEDLAGGIWEALLTTAAGLTVALPAMTLFIFFEHLVDRIGKRMTYAVHRVEMALEEIEGEEKA